MPETRESVLRRRISTQRLSQRRCAAAADVVRLLTAVQAQEYAHAFWSLGVRTRDATFADVKAAFDDGRFLRTHILRPTWHFVAAEDLRWMLAATSLRDFAAFGSTFRRLGIDDDVQGRAGDVLRGLICSGPMRGAQHTYALLDERVARQPRYDREEAVAELAFRFFAGHGPAGIKDLTRWSSLTVAEAQAAQPSGDPRR